MNVSLTWFDLVVLAVIGLSVVLAAARGVVRESLAIGVWIAAAAVAWFTFNLVRSAVAAEIRQDWLADGATLALVFALPWVVFKIIAAMTAAGLTLGLFGAVDRFLGAGFGLIRGAVLVGAGYLILALAADPRDYPQAVTQSMALPYVQDLAVLLAGWLPEHILATDSWRALPGLTGGVGQADLGARLLMSAEPPVQGTGR